ncbi:type III polyketide synthase [Deinococcus alpinitundrae]|uniref:type III polyketide synthase n=1 Tax=Deinococcus alpinitundrae TaxID=468913 RepID=UPI001379CC5D|nr:type III polyketide synthase [Deinococcus alpinitundrae]
MPVYAHSIATAVPETVYLQSELRDMVKAQPQLERLSQRLVSMIYNASAIDQRHSSIDELRRAPEDGVGTFYDPVTRQLLFSSTGVRNNFYAEAAPKLFTEAGRRAMASCPDLKASDITHVITVSCTGFYAPGPDYDVVRSLGLSAQTQRFHVGFMGCYAAFPALKMAKAFCEADAGAVVLVIAAELCSIHMRVNNDPDTLIASSLFADGAGAAIVSARPSLGSAHTLRLDAFETTLTPVGVGEADMAWKIGDEGFEMVLSTYVPDIIEAHIVGALTPLLNSEPQLAAAPHRQIERWAIHPGGRSILDKVQTSLDLSDEQLAPSREVLRSYGNMSSATVLFILKDLLENATDGERVCAMAFGPGLTVETGLMTHCPVPAAQASPAQHSGELQLAAGRH